MIFLDIDDFIAKYVTGRKESLFSKDMRNNEEVLKQRINGSSALIIGGAGTIGSSFIKALIQFSPKRLYVVDINENALTELTRDLRSHNNLTVPTEYRTYPMDMGHKVFEKLFLEEEPFDIVANFAAHKHVRSEKDPYSIQAMIENNVFNTKNLLKLLVKKPPQRFFCVSTDKAANPVNVMGASKKIMEEVILSYSDRINVSTARFANVAFSNGSLPDGFLNRLKKRQPLSSPLDIQRYFVSPEESGQLCLLACICSEPGNIFFPKISENEMKPFSEIAVDLLRELGYEAEYCKTEEEARNKAVLIDKKITKYPVYFFKTDTSGEKLFEEFFTEDEKPDLDKFEKLGVLNGKASISDADQELLFKELQSLFLKKSLSKKELISTIKRYLPSFDHLETGKSLDQKM
ncbi:MAG: NAD-dependent epimerase/dehydratase family protein [Bacteroidetes bacterium]|nr:MAG: NAD-dependent epimerase/dehydratase family protein [Bacteroidota bacterium]